MAEKGWEPLTLHLTAVDLILNQGARTTLYLGPRMASNFLGVRAGYISLGGHAGIQHQINLKLRLRAEIDGSAGGGGYAQDGDGWVLGSTASLIYGGRAQNLEAGLTYHYASGGMIGGFSPYIGWNRTLQLIAQPSAYGVGSARAGDRNAMALPASVGLFVQPSVGRQPYGDPEGDQAYPFTMLGAELRFEGRRLDHALSLSAAADTFGGYMLVMNTLTPKITQGKRVQLNPQVHLGAGGGVPRATEVPTHKAVPRYTLELGVGAKGYIRDSLWAACVGGEMLLLRKGPVSVYGSTWWAAVGGNLGAYAEGLLHAKIEMMQGVGLTASGGLGAGGGVNHLGNSYIAGLGIELGRSVPVHLQYWYGAPTRFSVGMVKKIKSPIAGIDR